MVGQATEPEVLEHASKPIFWLLAISILAFWFISVRPTSTSSPRQIITKTQFPIHFTSYIQPYITSLLLRLIFIALYASILVLQLLEGRWVLQTTFRFARAFFETFPAYEETPLWVYAVFLTSAGIVCSFYLFVVLAGVVIVSTQLIAILELVFGRSDARVEGDTPLMKDGAEVGDLEKET